MTDAKPELLTEWTIAGGTWGAAAWFQYDAGTVASIADDAQMPPTDIYAPVVLHLYRAPFYDGWQITDGECPTEHGDSECHEFANLPLAMVFLATHAHR